MDQSADVTEALSTFLRTSTFARDGAVMTDLDGTAIHQQEGRIFIPDPVSHGLKHLNDLGRPVILNSLRFPLNVIRTFGREWYSITNAALPLVSLNGGILGHLVQTAAGEIGYEEIAAFPLASTEVDEVMEGVRGLRAAEVDELLLFYYPRDWTQGEIIWTPVADRIDAVRDKYRSASTVFSGSVELLHERLRAGEICMIFLLVEIPQDRKMAFQHAKPSSFLTRKGVDKLSGAAEITSQLGLDLAQSVGCGDTPMDSFLKGVGLSVHVGPMDLEYHGLIETIKVPDSFALGDMLFRLADLQRRIPSG